MVRREDGERKGRRKGAEGRCRGQGVVGKMYGEEGDWMWSNIG